LTDGEKLLPPVGLRPFSVGDGVVVCELDVVVDVVEVAGAFSPPLEQPTTVAEITAKRRSPAAVVRRWSMFIAEYLSLCWRVFEMNP
jgi:hypothetical protein